MSAPARLAALLLVLLVAANTRLNAVVAGQPVSVPALWLIALAVLIALALAMLLVFRTIMRDGGLFLRPRTVSP